MFAKLNDGRIVYAPKKLSGDGVTVYNPPDSMYLEQGWKPVSITPPPEAPAGYYYESGWEETEEVIVQTWTLTPLPEEIDEAEAFDIIFGGAE